MSCTGLNPDLAAKAQALMARQYKIAIAANKRSEYIKGYKDSLDRNLDASRNDPGARAKGGKDGNTAIAGTKPKKKGSKPGTTKKGASKGNPKSGAFGGKKPNKKSVDDF